MPGLRTLAYAFAGILALRAGAEAQTAPLSPNDRAQVIAASFSVMRSFTLRDGRVDGALVTANKLYSNGDREKFEGVFINKTTRTSPTDSGRTEFGLGVIGKGVHLSGLTIDKFFYQLVQRGAAR